MACQVCYVILCYSIGTNEVAPTGVFTNKSEAESRLAELSALFEGYNRFEIQSSILETPMETVVYK